MITYAIEPQASCRADIELCLPDQWAETGDQGIDYKVNWELYAKLEQGGGLFWLTARDGDGLVGYLVCMVHQHPNSTDYKIGTIASYYVKPRTTRGLIERSLIAHGTNVAFQRGAWKVKVLTDWEHSFGRILELMGFRPKAVEYVMTRDMVRKEAVNA
jgi:hypothetical protein